MKKNITSTLLILLYLTTVNAFGQSAFFDELNPSTWKSAKRINDSTIKTVQEIQLSKVDRTKEAFKQDMMLLSFKNGIMTLSEYDSVLKKESMVSKYPYTIDFNKGILSLQVDDEESLNFKVGITSTGTYAILNRVKDKIKKEGKTSR